MHQLSRAFAVASLVLGFIVLIFSVAAEGLSISNGLLIGVILVLNGAVRLYEDEEA